MDYRKTNAPSNTVTRDMMKLSSDTGNVYETVAIIGKRANQIAVEMKQDLEKKLQEFASYNDNLEEVFENREQIEISRYYEKLPKPTLIAAKEYEDGKVYFAKTPSTPEDQSIGVLNGIRALLEELGVAPDCVTGVAHGTTVATNTLLERNGAVTALITTKGFRDVLDIGRQSRPELYDLHARKPASLIPRYLRREADERMDYTGTVLVQLDMEELKKTIHELMEEGAESIAICFLHSYANDENEKKALEVIREIAPDFPVSVSSEILPEFREFERMNTTVMNAYVQPRMQKYVSQLRRRLDENGINSPLTIMQSSGGMMTDQIAAQKSVNTLLSGPAGGVLAAEFLSKITDYHNIITGDLGGTSFDVGIVQNGSIGITGEGVIEGFPVKFPHIDITTIGAGGGSIAWLDAGGALRVGPRSAGAVPGPVCYSKGGTEPTVTDAHAVLGRVGEKLLGGKMHLDVAAARKAIEEKLAVKYDSGGSSRGNSSCSEFQHGQSN